MKFYREDLSKEKMCLMFQEEKDESVGLLEWENDVKSEFLEFLRNALEIKVKDILILNFIFIFFFEKLQFLNFFKDNFFQIENFN